MRPVLQFPHPSLSTQTTPWTFSVPTRGVFETRDDVDPDPGLEELFLELERDMPENGLALAANQVGLPHRMFLLSTQVCDETLLPRLIINPERLSDVPWPTCPHCVDADEPCVAHGGTASAVEGCLSFEGVRTRVVRPVMARFGFWDVLGNRREVPLFGHVARIFLHEVEHLDGKTFLDGMSSDDRSRVRVEMFKRRKDRRR